MIRFNVKAKQLWSIIDQEFPGWRAKAMARTHAATLASHVEEGEGIWSEIKTIYMRLQGYKCMYCEKPMPKQLEGEDALGADGASGKVEYDIEHFRPKNRVKPWPSSERKARRRIDYDAKLRNGAPLGYAWLAFDPLNFGVSCKTCNSELKADYFPILGVPGASSTSSDALDLSERPCLVHPIGRQGARPETYLEWLGPTVRPKRRPRSAEWIRGRVIVDFFEIDTRADLIFARCSAILLIWPHLGKSTASSRQFVAVLTSKTANFSGCLKAFVKLFSESPIEAETWMKKCFDFIRTNGSSGLT